MADPAFDEYLKTAEPRAHATLRVVDGAIRVGYSDFDVAIKYGILLYALRGDYRMWVVALGAHKNVVSLRFLYGVVLDDSRATLRKGTSTLMNWDFEFDEEVDSEAVSAYVREAVDKYESYKQNAQKIVDATRTPRGEAAKRPARKKTV